MSRDLRVAAWAIGACVLFTMNASAANPKFDSKLVTARTPGHAVEVDVDITGAKQLYLVVTDGGNGFACDWADWAEPRLIGGQTEKRLTDLKWKSAAADWGQVRINQNAEGGALRINNKPIEYGIGTHANSRIVFDLPAGYTRFKARAGLDNGGTEQAGGNSTSVRFLVYTEKPPQDILAQSRAASSQAGGNLDAEDALAALDVADGLEATIFASEPMLLSPSNIDVDYLGRVWVCEVVNYRGFRNKHKMREAGDRILILEDTDGDGRADKSTTFYQGRDIDSAHGVCVLGTPTGKGTRAIVSAGDSVFVFTDVDGDLKADKKDVLFTGISGVQHDHGIHAFVFGPDGKLYFNFGNEGRQIKDKHGKPIVDRAGNEVNDQRKPYQQGMVFRCNLDGSEFETLAWNFRNNWEVCVDSFGTLWQSDNDDDGNRGVRINYVMEFGNYGYRDELTGAGWQTPRTGMHEEVPQRHWHLNDPGVVPNLLQTGAGSPTGICVYEGDLLPKVFRNQMVHCDAGPNIVRAYPVENDGAGYQAEIVNILEGTRDKWFRPSDVCVAPDGSLIVADWYDPGVGGHAMGDINRGRLFRVAPPGTTFTVPKYDFNSIDGAIEALKSPNLSARQIAWTALHQMQQQAERELRTVFTISDNPRHRARALWLLGKIEVCGEEYVQQALTDTDPNIRITALRLARQIMPDVLPLVKQLVKDESPQVRRECAIALRHHPSEEAAELWAALAAHPDGIDRWYVEALGVGADKQWDSFLSAWLEKAGNNWNTPNGRDVIWRSRASVTPEYLAKIIADPSVPRVELPRYLRAFDFQTGDGTDAALEQLAFKTQFKDQERQTFVAAEALQRLKPFDANSRPELLAALNKVLDGSQGTEQFVRLVDKFSVQQRYPELLALAQEKPQEQIAVEAVRTLLGKGQRQMIRDALLTDDLEVATATAQALGTSGDGRAVGLLQPVMHDQKRPVQVRRHAARAVAQSRNGALELVKLSQANSLDPALKDAVAAALHSVQWQDLKEQAEKLFPLPPTKNNQPLPPVEELVKRNGNIDRGRLLFNTEATCAKCHVVGGVGKEVGPNLSAIGKKLSRQAMFESILFPNAGISHNYETYVVLLDSGNVVNGIKVSETPDEVSLKGIDAIVRTFKKSEIEDMRKQDVSLMPADLQKVMTAEDLVDVVQYMETLKQENP